MRIDSYDLDKILSLTLIVGSISLLGALGIIFGIDENKYKQATRIADINKDDITTEREWQKVYQKLGIHYDSRNPQELTNGHLKRYISSYDNLK